MKVLITGAAGFIGAAVAQELSSRGHEVVGLGRHAHEEQNIFAADVSKPGAGAEHFQDVDAVVHTAAMVSYAMSHEEAFRVNVQGTKSILDTARAAGVKRFVHISSVVVYPDVPEQLDEDSPIRTNGVAYMDTKVLSEIPVYHAMIKGDIEGVIIRPGDVYGPRSRPWTQLPYEAMKKKMFALPMWGKGHFTPIFIDDLARGIASAVETPAAAGEIFNLTDGTVVTCKEFFRTLATYTKTGSFPVLPSAAAIGASGIISAVSSLRGESTETNPNTMHYLMRRTGGYSIAKARRILGFEPRVCLNEGQRRAAEWCLQQD
ncbi:NAD(P)-dependent oxidoreductase [Corynebacterium sp.]|uniref:NAD-dependent epimerase/dehydratase family protein n=1 Tax=Corynebacterium sp. TaxID=1720 RepID=UPI0026DB7432|nr:NAD(P)-dependent oxidoreductase [Corynebacterium sp.]MDO5031907.1 NAD(P)-dependent oxidoreductase [Corynebacterium sp.]